MRGERESHGQPCEIMARKGAHAPLLPQEMLDLMDFSRTDQHRLILTQLKSRMLSRIPSLSVEKQLALLNKCFK